METSDGVVISEARLGTIPNMVVWMLLLYILLALQMNMALALSDHNKQVIAYDCGNPCGIQAYDTGERNHWCDLNPLLDDTNTDITITYVSYVLLQKVSRVRIKIRTCKVIMTIRQWSRPWPNGESREKCPPTFADNGG
jgi:hypothetical protein